MDNSSIDSLVQENKSTNHVFGSFVPSSINLDSLEKLSEASKKMDNLLMFYINHHPHFKRKFPGPKMWRELKKRYGTQEKYFKSPEYQNSKHGKLEYAFAGGKRVRPLIMDLVCNWLGKPFDPLFPAAISIEMIHKASLIMDDIRDEADKKEPKLRDGREPFVNKNGTAAASEFCLNMLTKAKRFLDKSYIKNRNGLFLRDFDRTVDKMIDGQMDETDEPINTIEQCIGLFDLKTVSLPLYAVIMPIVYYEDELPPDSVQPIKIAAKKWARDYGRVFQIADDIGDYLEDNKKEKANLNIVDVIALENKLEDKIEALEIAKTKAREVKNELVSNPFKIINVDFLPLNYQI